MEAVGDHAGKEKQTNACEKIKKIHGALRSQLKQGEALQDIWEKHKDNKQFLIEYSEAMVSLAQIWESSHPPSENRIDWCVFVARKYFSFGGLEKSLEKELKGKFHSLKRAGQCQLETVEEFLSSGFKANLEEKVRDFQNRKLQLIDVGSCYNPFKKFSEEFEVLAIDLHPATKDVYKADFLSLKINENSNRKAVTQEGNLKWKSVEGGLKIVSNDENRQDCGGGMTYEVYNFADLHAETVLSLATEKSGSESQSMVVEELPASFFDVAVFSLVLSYLPSPRQRWESCVQANKLLSLNSLLCIIEPDSAHQNRNAHQMRAWKEALAEAGFVRHCYEKLPHLHCMAFRKVKDICGPIPDKSNLMFIPQDSHEECEQETYFNEKRNEDQDKEVSNFFENLPNVF